MRERKQTKIYSFTNDHLFVRTRKITIINFVERMILHCNTTFIDVKETVSVNLKRETGYGTIVLFLIHV